MILKVIADDQLYELNVPQELLEKAGEFFDRMDHDMDAGVQMSRDWVENPNLMQRIQVVGDKLLTALENENHNLGRLMAGYILDRLPQIDTLELDTSGDISNTLVNLVEDDDAPDLETPPARDRDLSGNMEAAYAQAEKEVSKVFKAGRQYRFSVYNSESGQWEQSPAIGDEQQAEAMRDFAFNKRFRELAGKGGEADPTLH